MKKVRSRQHARTFGVLVSLRGKTDFNALQGILRADEKVEHCVYGYYAGGSGLLVATKHRLLLIDKRPLYLHVEEISYASIKDALMLRRFLHGTVHIKTMAKRLKFRTVSDAHIQDLYDFIETKRAAIKRDIRDGLAAIDQVNKGFVPHPAWRPHAPHMIRGSRPIKFHRKLGRVASV